MNTGPFSKIQGSRPFGFTLLETLLALGIALALLVVVLYFYQQTTSFRSQLLKEMDRVTAVSKVMNLMTTELRSALRHEKHKVGLRGGRDFIQILSVGIPHTAAWNAGVDDPLQPPATDLRQVGYFMGGFHEEEIWVPGLVRWEEPLLDVRESEGEAEEEAPVENPPYSLFDASPVMAEIQHVRFRYWDGVGWWEHWDFIDLPYAVEISMATRPQPEDTPPQEPPETLYQRVVYIPGSMNSFAAPTPDRLDDLVEDEKDPTAGGLE